MFLWSNNAICFHILAFMMSNKVLCNVSVVYGFTYFHCQLIPMQCFWQLNCSNNRSNSIGLSISLLVY